MRGWEGGGGKPGRGRGRTEFLLTMLHGTPPFPLHPSPSRLLLPPCSFSSALWQLASRPPLRLTSENEDGEVRWKMPCPALV